MKDLYLDARHGIAGDMLLAALVHLGAPLNLIREQLQKFLPAFDLSASEIQRRGITAYLVDVDGREAHPPHRHLSDIKKFLESSTLSKLTKERALAVFGAIAEAEGEVHGVAPQKVHFHEVGAMDSIVDVLASLLAVELLEIDRITCSSLPLGSGNIQIAHGRYPVPAPATLLLLQGIPSHPFEVNREVSTPTGVALAKILADEFGPPPAGIIQRVGYGAGTRIASPEEPPNLLRAWTLQADRSQSLEQVAVLETNLDTLSGEEAGHLLDLLQNAGALDTFYLHTVQKKSRPGLLLTVIAPEQAVAQLTRILFEHSGSLGIRHRLTQRQVLRREFKEVEWAGTKLQIKLAYFENKLISARPEFDDLAKLSQSTGQSISELRRQWQNSSTYQDLRVQS